MLPITEFTYNNSKHSSTGITPFYAMYGYNPEFIWDVEVDVPGREAPTARDRAVRIQSVHDQAMACLCTAVAS